RAVSLLRLILRTMSGKAASPSSLVHDSMGVPPTLALISPIGTPYFSYNFFAKKYETTEKRRIFPRVAVIQLPDGRSATGPAKADRVGTVNCRICGWFAAATSAAYRS